MRLQRGTTLHGDELELFNRVLKRNYERAEVVWVDSDEPAQAQVRVTVRGQQQLINVPAVIEETEPVQEEPEAETSEEVS